jgi:1-acyl-sn-glycerol-3-phosphate acyltransferase
MTAQRPAGPRGWTPWLRRLVLAPAVVALGVFAAASLPLLGLVALVLAPVLPGRMRLLRLAWFVLLYLWLETALLIALGALWVATGFGWAMTAPWSQRVHYRLLGLTVGLLRLEAERVLGVTIVHDGATPGELSGRPLVVLARHAGAGDSFMLIDALVNVVDREPRIVLKAALQWDPGLDILLNRLPTHFVGDDSREQHLAAIRVLATALDDDDAFVIFPEGGNFTPERRARSIAWLRANAMTERAETAERMSNVLPPREAGTTVALLAAPEADVAIVAHTGLEHLTSIRALWRYLPMDTEIRLHWWQVPKGEVPRDQAGIADWLFGWWAIVDSWIEANQPPVVRAARADAAAHASTQPRNATPAG